MQRIARLFGFAALATSVLVTSLVPSAALAAPAEAPYRASSPEYGMSVFVYGNSNTTARDLGRLKTLGFGWQKSLFRWRDIETDCKGCYQWGEADRIVQASGQNGLKIIARIDFPPTWARADRANNGAPDNYQDFADFIRAFTERYKTGSTYGTVQAIEVWNEVNLQREWGAAISQQSAVDYVRLLGLAYKAAKAADPNVTVITAGLSPTGWNDDTARPDDEYLQWMYGAGLKGGLNYDVLGVNANTQCPSVEADFGACPVMADRMGHPSFYFRRVEQLRGIMEANGDTAQQVWLLEFGWTTDPVNPSYSWYATTEDRKAQLFMDAFKYASTNWAPWIGVMTVWTLADPRWGAQDEQVYWAVTNPDGTTRPAYDRLLKASKGNEFPLLTAPAAPTAPVAAPAPGPAAPVPQPVPVEPAVSTPRSPAPVLAPAAPPTATRLRVLGPGTLNLRATPGRDAAVKKELAENAIVTVIGDAQQADGVTWYNVRDGDGTEGWASAQYLVPTQ